MRCELLELVKFNLRSFLCSMGVAWFSLFFVFTLPVVVNAAQFGSEWQGEARSKVRLIAGEGRWLGKKTVVAGIEIQLAPQWKTYWRVPGDAGIPPNFDFSGSQNLKKVEVLYPVPRRYFEPSGLTIGYKKRVVFPVLLQPIDPGQPIELNLSAAFGICDDICIPVEVMSQLKVGDVSGSPFSSLLDVSLQTVPEPLKAASMLGVQRVKLVQGGVPHLTLLIKTEQPDLEIDLFIEGPGGLYVPTPKRIEAGEPDSLSAVFRVDLSDENLADFQKAKLVCTMKIGDQAFVQPCPVN